MNFLLEIKDVCKSYNQNIALQNVNINIEPGKIIGLLGPNGSGKTTLIKIINNLITDYSGEILVNGNPIGVLSKKDISYLPDTEFLNTSLKISEVLKIYSTFYEDFNSEKASHLLSILDLNENSKLKSLSKGMREKVNLALVLSRDAKLYVFDEPLAAVDPASRQFIIDSIINNYNKESSILLSTHLISDIEPIIDHAIFINRGNIILDKPADILREERGMSIDQIFREEFKCLVNY